MVTLRPGLGAAADAAYDREDQEWFNSQSTEDLVALWEVACDLLAGGAAWDDEVFEALDARGHFDEKPAPFEFDGNYKNHEQVRPYMDDFLRVFASFDPDLKFAYNDQFKGRIPGIADGPSEDTGIYLLQTLKSLDELAVQVEKFKAEGGRVVTADDVGDKVLRGTVVFTGFYVGGTGWREFRQARLLRQRRAGGELGFLCVLPKGKRTNGYLAEGTVLLKEE